MTQSWPPSGSALRDRNTVMFYLLLSEHLEEIMPIGRTPSSGAAIVDFSRCATTPSPRLEDRNHIVDGEHLQLAHHRRPGAGGAGDDPVLTPAPTATTLDGLTTTTAPACSACATPYPCIEMR